MLKIAIDPGHGMSNRRWGVYDPGAVAGDVQEAQVVLAVAVFAMAGFDSDPPRWLVGFVASLAATCIWALTRWRMHRTRCLLDEIKVGGTD